MSTGPPASRGAAPAETTLPGRTPAGAPAPPGRRSPGCGVAFAHHKAPGVGRQGPGRGRSGVAAGSVPGFPRRHAHARPRPLPPSRDGPFAGAAVRRGVRTPGLRPGRSPITGPGSGCRCATRRRPASAPATTSGAASRRSATRGASRRAVEARPAGHLPGAPKVLGTPKGLPLHRAGARVRVDRRPPPRSRNATASGGCCATPRAVLRHTHWALRSNRRRSRHGLPTPTVPRTLSAGLGHADGGPAGSGRDPRARRAARARPPRRGRPAAGRGDRCGGARR